ncbi:MAG TPA: IS66 family transposase [Isosphaeraceae bacterium]|nr:IS66 family transposase [Isosphaeraceae bacterium]
MTRPTSIPQHIWETLSTDAQVVIAEVIDQLEQRIADLEERLNKNSTNSSKPPSSDPPSVKRRPPAAPSGKRRGGQPGHHRHTRPLVPPEQVHETFDCKPAHCRRCGHGLAGEDPQPLRHQVAEIPPVQPVVTEYRLHRLHCPQCGTSTCGAVPPGVPTGAFGPRLHAVLSLLAGGYRLGQRPIQQIARDLFGLSVSLGMIAKSRRQTAVVLERPVAELRQHVQQAEVVHIDETSWREDKAKAWLWVALTPLVTVFTIAATRCGGVARQILGEVARRVIVSDRFSSYGWIEVRQFCWAHLRRDFQAMIDRGGEAAEVGRRLLEHSNKLFHWWHRVRDGTMARSTLKGYTDPLRWAVRKDLRRGAECSCAKTAATCRELLAGEAHLWTFLRVEGVDPTNNAAERALRHAVIWRKTSGGTEGGSGSPFVERMLSVVATCRQQGRNALEYLTACHEAPLLGHPAPSLLPTETTESAAA